MVPDH